MASKGKEKEVATGGKRRRGDASDEDKARKRKNREVLRFFEDAADVDDDESDYSDFDDEEYEIELKVKKEPRTPNLPFVPKEEEMDEEEFDKMMEERYRTRSGFARYPEDTYDEKSGEGASGLPSTKDPKIWKVKCMVGREKHSAFCLMQKFVDLKSLGTKLQIISAFAFDHVKGFVYIESDKQCDIVEACKGLCGIYSTRASVVQGKEVQYLLSVRRKANVIREGMWAHVKNGKYKGDIAQVVSVNDARKKATVKLIPRIDLQMMAKKIGGGISIKNAATPAPRLINSSELEEFRPLIQYRRDRDTGLMVEVLDGLMFKDGFLYKKVSVDSLNFSGVTPSEEELVKFQPSENNDVDNSEWLSQLYGSPKKKRMGNDKGGEKGESSSGSGMQNGFELYDLVCVGRKDFGLIVGMEKDDYFKILKHGPEAQIVSTSARRDVKSGPADMKFSAFDRHSKTVSVNDTIKVLEGPLKDRQGIVKHIYRGIVFAHGDQNETENGGYFCCKSQMCEKINMSDDVCKEKGGESGFFGFEDSPSSPKSPLSPKMPWQTFESNRESNQGDKEGTFSIGQTLRIRTGPLKGYLCRVLAIRYSEATVKLDSQHKVLTVKFEHLAEVRGRNTAVPSSEDPGSSSFKPFDMLGTEGGTGWANGAGTSADGSGWNTGGNTESTPWPSFSASGFKQPDSSGTKEEDSAWGRTENSTQNASWGATATNENTAGNNESNDSWSKAATKVGSSSCDGWGKPKLDSVTNENTAGNNESNDSWSKAATKVGSSSSDGWGKPDSGSSHGAAEAWGKGKPESENPSGSWAAAGEMKSGSWDKSTNAGDDNWNKASAWNQQKSEPKADAWGSKEAQNEGGAQGDSWGKNIEKDSSSGGNVGWNSSDSAAKKPEESNWGNPGSSWAQPEAQNNASDSGWTKAKVDGTSQTAGWGQQDESTWGKQEGGESAWNKQDGGSKKESSWGKQDGGSSWNQKDGGSGSSGWGNKDGDVDNSQGSGWGNKDGDAGNSQGSGWGNKSSWSAPDASGWNQKTEENDGKDGGDGWNSGKASDGGSTKGWGQGSSWGTGSNDAGKNDESSWGKKSSWNSGAGNSGGKTSSSWGKSGGWSSGTGEEKQESYGWGKKSSWNQDDSVSGGGDQGSGGWRGGYGGSERGGYRGRGERGGGFRGRGDRGGYRGRGRSDRGGYGGRGRRDEGGDSGGGWSGGGGGGSWSQGGDDKSQGKSWSSSWNQGGGDGESGGGWNKGDGEAGKGGWKSAEGSGGSGEGAKGSSGWNQGGGWNGGGSSSTKGGDGAGGSGWN